MHISSTGYNKSWRLKMIIRDSRFFFFFVVQKSAQCSKGEYYTHGVPCSVDDSLMAVYLAGLCAEAWCEISAIDSTWPPTDHRSVWTMNQIYKAKRPTIIRKSPQQEYVNTHHRTHKLCLSMFVWHRNVKKKNIIYCQSLLPVWQLCFTQSLHDVALWGGKSIAIRYLLDYIYKAVSTQGVTSTDIVFSEMANSLWDKLNNKYTFFFKVQAGEGNALEDQWW